MGSFGAQKGLAPWSSPRSPRRLGVPLGCSSESQGDARSFQETWPSVGDKASTNGAEGLMRSYEKQLLSTQGNESQTSLIATSCANSLYSSVVCLGSRTGAATPGSSAGSVSPSAATSSGSAFLGSAVQHT